MSPLAFLCLFGCFQSALFSSVMQRNNSDKLGQFIDQSRQMWGNDANFVMRHQFIYKNVYNSILKYQIINSHINNQILHQQEIFYNQLLGRITSFHVEFVTQLILLIVELILLGFIFYFKLETRWQRQLQQERQTRQADALLTVRNEGH